jgi:hydrogenase maturation protease
MRMLTFEVPVDVRPTLVIAIGNPSRGDDALGPLLAERLAALGLPEVEVLTDFQLQVEHALDLLGRGEVIFVDATTSGDAAYTFNLLAAAEDASMTTHALTPQTLLACYQRVTGKVPPRARVLAVRGRSFELGAPLTAAASTNLDVALTALVKDLGRA